MLSSTFFLIFWVCLLALRPVYPSEGNNRAFEELRETIVKYIEACKSKGISLGDISLSSSGKPSQAASSTSITSNTGTTAQEEDTQEKSVNEEKPGKRKSSSQSSSPQRKTTQLPAKRLSTRHSEVVFFNF